MSELNKLLKLKAAEIDRILDRATKLMSMLTNYTGLALKRVQNARLWRASTSCICRRARSC